LHTIYTRYSFVFVLSAVILTACSTKKDAFVNRTFHQITAKYNGYFNGRESLKEGLKVINRQMPDDFYQILPALKVPPEENVSAIYPQMDRAIEKATAVIQNHSMTIRGREKNKWIDENYLLIGKARYYKGEYNDALKTFEYVSRKFRRDESAIEAKIWATRCHVQIGNYSNANTYITELRRNRNLPVKSREQLFTIEGELAHKEGDSKGAIRLFKSAMGYTKKKQYKMRYMFIMAQLNQEIEEYSRAAALYKKIAKMNPTYDMEFYSKINRARSFDVFSGRSAQMKRELLKMVDDDKNKDYLDEIYYAVADVYLREENVRKGKEYLRLAASNSSGNAQLQTKVYLRLADMYYEDKEYAQAKPYYDTTLQVIPDSDLRFEDIKMRRDDLVDLVEYLNTIHRNDSLLRIVGLDEEDRNSFIDRLIAQQRREDKQKAEREKEALLAELQANVGGGPGNNLPTTQGGWYFYNAQAIGLGFTEFQSQWGNRLLEDNWRRKNKRPGIGFENEEELVDNGIEGDGINDKYNRDFYEKQLPLSAEAQAEFNTARLEAYYNAGLVYKDKFRDYTSSIKDFEELQKEYPESKYDPNALYALYRLNLLIGVNSEAEKFKQLLIAKYPLSTFAKAALNANAEGVLTEASKEVEQLYQNTFQAFKGANYPLVIDNANRAVNEFSDNVRIPKFKYLDAISKGKLYGASRMQIELRGFVNDYPSHELKPQAEALLEKLGMLEGDTIVANLPIEEPAVEDEIQIDGNYTYNESMEGAFNYIMVVPNQLVDMNVLKATISDFDATYFSQETLTVKSFFLNIDYQLISVTGLKNGADALTYFAAVNANPSIREELTGVSYEHFVISQTNFGSFYGQKDVGGYLLFFKDKILKK
jgi:tetratricopeptide (TPR) repeat protein